MGLLDIVFPKSCLECGKVGRYVCEECVNRVPRAKAICPYCHYFSPNGETHENCAREFGLDGLTSIWEYKGIIRKAILALKYKYATEIGKEISEYTIASVKNLSLPFVHILTPVPIYWHKQNTRGLINQLSLAVILRKICG